LKLSNKNVNSLLLRPDIVLYSGIAELDKLIGGFKAGELTFIEGELTFPILDQICVNTYRTFGSDTLYIGTGINPYRIASYARMLELDPREVLKHVHVSRAFTVHQLSTLVYELLYPAIQRYKPRTLIIDTTLYSDAKSLLTRDIKKVRELTTKYLLITLLTGDERLYIHADKLVTIKEVRYGKNGSYLPQRH
jgi:KaiC/GvpD/RAD55 family RecA-like ATPase